jgi:hypothetical protein
MPLKALIDGLLTPRGARNGLGVNPSAFRYPVGAGALPHRNAITVIDKLGLAGTVTPTAITEGGSNLTNVAHYGTIIPFNRWGAAGQAAPTIVTVTPTANQAVRLAFSAITGADGYDIFLSTSSTAPLWVGRITEAQRAAGGIISSVGVYSAGGAVNSIDVGIVGTGLGPLVAPFSSNNAYTPASVKPFDCTGVSRVHALVKLAVTDLRSLPALTIVPFLANQASPTDWFQGTPQALSLLSATGQSLIQDFEIDVDGAAGLVVLVDTISGQGAAASVWLEAA